MAAEETTNQGGKGNITTNFNAAQLGLNMDNSIAQIKKGTLTYALNAAVENFDSNSVNYQNEPANEFCVSFPVNYTLIGKYFIPEKNKHVFFLVSPGNNQSQIGYMINNDCVYRPLLSLPCLSFNINYPIHKVVHKITNCTEEIYWTDGLNPRRYLDLASQMPTDCNLLKIQPNFNIPQLVINDVVGGGQLTAGTYQFAIQYANANGIGYTSYYSVTNPLPIANVNNVETLQFDYIVNRSIQVNISNIDNTGYYEYYNLAVIKTVNDIESVELVGTYFIDSTTNAITYTGQNQTQIQLSLNDIFEKFPFYDVAQDVTSVQDVLVWDNLTSDKRISYQKIANQITTQWQTYRLPTTENYSNAVNATNLRGYLRDEVYAFEIVFLLRNGKQTDGFHIPGRAFITGVDGGTPGTTILNTNPDYIGTGTSSPKWKIYNTASFTGFGGGADIGSATPYQYGQFAFWESNDVYPNNPSVWGSLAGQKIRHHKFPDVLVSPLMESTSLTIGPDGTYSNIKMNSVTAIYPIGLRISALQINTLIQNSTDLTTEEKSDIVGFKIVRGDRSTNKSIVGKGILRNVGTYNRGKTVNGNGVVVSQGTNYYLPNYPYNDLRDDPFINAQSNGNNAKSVLWFFQTSFGSGVTSGDLSYTDPFTGETVTKTYTPATFPANKQSICSLTVPTSITPGFTIGNPINVISGEYATTAPPSPYKGRSFRLSCLEPGTFTKFVFTDTLKYRENPSTITANEERIVYYGYPVVVNAIAAGGGTIGIPVKSLTQPAGSDKYSIQLDDTTNPYCLPSALSAFADVNPLDPNSSKYRMVFNSPETSFLKPTLGNILKLESVIFGGGQAHFKEVEKNAQYKLITRAAQQQALDSAYDLAAGTSFDVSAFFVAYQTYLAILVAGISRENFGYSFNSIATYDYSAAVTNSGQKQRILDKYQYLIPGVQSVSDLYNVNNFQRESSVYLKTDSVKTFLPFPSNSASIQPGGIGTPSLVSDNSRITLSQVNTCTSPETLKDIKVISYYGSLKNQNVNQYGQIYSYETVDTGFQLDLDLQSLPTDSAVFGGDTFIGKLAFKTKLPFFIDNTVGAVNDADIFYEELGNVAYPKFWHSSNSITSDVTVGNLPDLKTLPNIISVKTRNFDCPNFPVVVNNSLANIDKNFTNYIGKFYMFAYGIPYFYCESGINLDLRQAFNNKEGNFFPRVSTGIPDEWLQESFVSINFDNTYFYNTTYSRQNTQNFFSHLPIDFNQANSCYTYYPFRAIYSDEQNSDPTGGVNNWLTYRATSFFDFPQNYGDLISLDGIQNKAVLARFENKSLLYNTMLTINTSNPQAAYIGNDTLFRSSPPIDFAETNLGYVGSQNKFLLKIPQGQITVDAKRGQIFLISGNQATDLTGFGSGVNRFMTDHLAFEILRYFPDADIDNNFNGIGLHGVFDSKFDRIIITKLDYIPQPAYVGVIKYGNDPVYTVTYRKYYTGTQQSPTIVSLTNPTYFCNKSWTLSFNMNTRSWISFHSYIPNYYIAENNFFYSGLSEGCALTFVAASSIVGNCTLAGYASLATVGCLLQGNALTVPPGTTTTTTTRLPICTLAGVATVSENCLLAGNALSGPPSTTTTTTTVAPNCALEGVAVPPENCLLAGNATTETILPTTTTTTTAYVPFCNLAGVATVSSNCLLVGNAASIPPAPTTTTTTTVAPTTTTTTTTEYIPFCNLAGVATVNSDCLLAGNAYNIIPATTTTTTTAAPTTTTTTTQVASVVLDPRNSLSVTSYTPFINGVADPSWDSGSRSYPLGTTIRVDYSSPACNVTLNGGSIASGSIVVLTTTATQTYVLLNADHYVNDGETTCVDCQLRQPIINDCGTTSYTVVEDESCDCNQNCKGTYYGEWYCQNNQTKRDQYYFCNNSPTGVVEIDPNCTAKCTDTYFDANWSCVNNQSVKYQRFVCNNALTGQVQTNPNCTVACTGTYFGAWYCDNNQSKRKQYYTCNNAETGVIETNQDCTVACTSTYFGSWVCENNQSKRSQFYTCNNTFTGVVETNPDCTVACTGTYFVDTCDAAKTLTRTQKYSCNNANTGVIETYPCNVGTCGASLVQNQGGQVGTYYSCSNGTVNSAPVYINDNACYSGSDRWLLNGVWQSPNPSNTYPDTTASYQDQNYQACYQPSCTTGQVFKDINPCSSTYNNYFIEVSGNKINVFTQPSGLPCDYSPICLDTGEPYCIGPDLVINLYQANPCSTGTCPPYRIYEVDGCYVPPTCESLRMTNDNGAGLTDYIEYTNCFGTVVNESLSDGSFIDICRLLGTPFSYSYSYPTYLGPCS